MLMILVGVHVRVLVGILVRDLCLQWPPSPRPHLPPASPSLPDSGSEIDWNVRIARSSDMLFRTQGPFPRGYGVEQGEIRRGCTEVERRPVGNSGILRNVAHSELNRAGSMHKENLRERRMSPSLAAPEFFQDSGFSTISSSGTLIKIVCVQTRGGHGPFADFLPFSILASTLPNQTAISPKRRVLDLLHYEKRKAREA